MRPVCLTLLLVPLLLLTGAAEANGIPDIVGLLREFGFPIFVSVWFMRRMEKRMEKFTDTIQTLLTAVTIMAKTMDNWEHDPPSHEEK